MKNTFHLPAQNEHPRTAAVELALSLMENVNPCSIIADANDNVRFADMATNRIIKVAAFTTNPAQYN